MQALPSFPEVPLEKLRWRCHPETFSFHTTDEVEPFDAIIGQERAQKALTLGVEIAKAGYNIYVCGATGTGRATAVQQLFAQRQGQGTPPSDLCYVYNFKNPDSPKLLQMPAGQGKALKKTMESLLSALKQDIPKTLADEGFQRRQDQNLRQAKRRERRLVKQLEKHVGPDFGLLWRDAEHNLEPELAPIIEGHLTSLSDLEERLEAGRFTTQDYQQVRERFEALSVECTNVFANVRRLRHEAQEAGRTLERAVVRPIIHQAVNDASAASTDTNVHQYFQEVETALYEDIERFHEPPLPPMDKDTATPVPHLYEEDDFHEYHINLIVDNADTTGAPVIFETSPTYKNLFGAIEPTMEYGGVWRSDFMGIRAGAIHRAHGGYLIFNAIDALAEPVVWATLKRTLRYRQAEIQAFDQLALMPGTTLKPEPVPCDVKIIMLGNEDLYYTLAHDDEDFKRLFKVKAEFDTTLAREPHSILQYAGFIQRICRDESLHPFDRSAVAAVVEYGIRLAGRQNRLTARLDVIADVLREADYWTSKAGAPVVTVATVQQALAERLGRLRLTEERLHEVIAQGLLLITTRGAVIGQVNGLAVYDMEEDYAFGWPMRITAETSMGDTGVVNIEREVNLSDATHNKGVLILSGYLRHAYVHDQPLVLTASLCVEQSYEGIVGDSASAAEMYALLSSLAELPIDQGLAITGSVNQKGDLQPISGINEKIEGFFDVCRLQGLTGTQGVLLPIQNVDDLMLREDVIAAITAGQFHLYPIATIDAGLPMVMGWPVGTRQADQTYPPHSVNGRIEARLRRFAERWYSLQHGYVSGQNTPTVAAACPTCQPSAAAQSPPLSPSFSAPHLGWIAKVQALFRATKCRWPQRRP